MASESSFTPALQERRLTLCGGSLGQAALRGHRKTAILSYSQTELPLGPTVGQAGGSSGCSGDHMSPGEMAWPLFLAFGSSATWLRRLQKAFE